jgi:hypothetical protein
MKRHLGSFREEQKLQQLDAFLHAHLYLIPEAQRTLKVAIPIARAVDMARRTLSTKLDGILGFALWEQVKEGILRYCDKPPATLHGGHPTKEDMELFGPAIGYRMIDPNGRDLVTDLENIFESFKAIHYGTDHQKRIDMMTVTERRAVAQTVSKGFAKCRNIFSTIEDLRQFTSARSISSLNSWSQKNGPYFRLHIRLEYRELYIGRDADNLKRFVFQEEYFRALTPLPSFGKLELRRIA